VTEIAASRTTDTYKPVGFAQGWTGHCGNVAIAEKLFFFENARIFVFKTAWHFSDIFREIEADSFYRHLRLLLINMRLF
jgi:hypothetical protein